MLLSMLCIVADAVLCWMVQVAASGGAGAVVAAAVTDPPAHPS